MNPKNKLIFNIRNEKNLYDVECNQLLKKKLNNKLVMIVIKFETISKIYI